MRHSLAVSDCFAEVVKVMDHTRLWDAELAWYSPRFDSVAWNTTFEHIVLGLPDFAWLSQFLWS